MADTRAAIGDELVTPENELLSKRTQDIAEQILGNLEIDEVKETKLDKVSVEEIINEMDIVLSEYDESEQADEPVDDPADADEVPLSELVGEIVAEPAPEAADEPISIESELNNTLQSNIDDTAASDLAKLGRIASKAEKDRIAAEQAVIAALAHEEEIFAAARKALIEAVNAVEQTNEALEKADTARDAEADAIAAAADAYRERVSQARGKNMRRTRHFDIDEIRADRRSGFNEEIAKVNALRMLDGDELTIDGEEPTTKSVDPSEIDIDALLDEYREHANKRERDIATDDLIDEIGPGGVELEAIRNPEASGEIPAFFDDSVDYKKLEDIHNTSKFKAIINEFFGSR